MALQSLAALVGTDLRTQLPAIDRPTLVISGERDPICPTSASAYMAERIPDCRHVVYAGCGHAPFLSHSDEVNACLAGFSREVAGAYV